jgi:acyl carrier protein
MTVDTGALRECFKVALKLTAAEASSMGPETDIWNLPKWDSLGHVRLVLELERRFGVKLQDTQTAELVSVAEIIKALGPNAEI